MSNRPLRDAIQGREADQQMADDSRAARTKVEAHIDVQGSGETRKTIRFPVTFAEKPTPTFGGELDANHSPEAGRFPVISVMVVQWTTVDKGEGRVYYTGCDVGIVALGKTNQRVIAHCVFEGLAFRDPIRRRRGGL